MVLGLSDIFGFSRVLEHLPEPILGSRLALPRNSLNKAAIESFVFFFPFPPLFLSSFPKSLSVILSIGCLFFAFSLHGLSPHTCLTHSANFALVCSRSRSPLINPSFVLSSSSQTSSSFQGCGRCCSSSWRQQQHSVPSPPA